MDLEKAKVAFMELARSINPNDLPGFIHWVRESEELDIKGEDEVILDNIAEDLRQMVPFEAVLPSENLYTPDSGKNADCDGEVTLHVDCFLFDDAYIDNLVEEEKFSRNYCLECRSRNTKPLIFISHSASRPMLDYMFKNCLPDLSSKTIVDIGSRLGPILYAAYLYSSATKIIGIELNEDFCQIQKQVITKYGMSDKISIINDDVINCSPVLNTGDVIVMHNVFEFFTEASNLTRIWTYIIETLRRSGQLLVTSPSLDESLRPIGMEHLIAGWVKEVDVADNEEQVHVYVVT